MCLLVLTEVRVSVFGMSLYAHGTEFVFFSIIKRTMKENGATSPGWLVAVNGTVKDISMRVSVLRATAGLLN